MQLNPAFVSNIHDLYGPSGDLWLQGLPIHIDELSAKWNFRFIGAINNLTYNFVALVQMNAAAKTGILKIGPPRGNVNTEIRWLNCFQKGVPRVGLTCTKYQSSASQRL